MTQLASLSGEFRRRCNGVEASAHEGRDRGEARPAALAQFGRGRSAEPHALRVRSRHALRLADALPTR